MTIHVSFLLPWILTLIPALLAGGVLNLVLRYPKDPTMKGWVICAVLFYAASMLTYYTRTGWLVWK